MSPSIRWRKASEVRKRKPQANDVPGTFVSKAEKAVDGAKDTIVKHYKAVSDYIGERPFGQKKLSERQQVRRYLAFVRENEAAWTGLLQQKGEKATVEYALRMERLVEKYPDEAEYMTPEAEANG